MPVTKLNIFKALPIMALALMLGACDADSPTEPSQAPNPAVPQGGGSATGFSITVSPSPRTFELESDATITITIVARRTDNNAFVPQGSTAVLTSTSGVLTNEAGNSVGNSITIVFGSNGTAAATLAALTETATIRAQIEQSSGQAVVEVTEAPLPVPLTIAGLVPNFGPPAGNTQVRIEGTGFFEPVRVTLGGINAPVLSVSESSIQILTPPIDLPSGQNRAVGLILENAFGTLEAATDTLNNAFTYTRNQTPLVPKIISVTPTSGPNEGGTPVTIFGEAFGSEIQVFFGAGSRIEAEVLDISPTRILVRSPPATGQNSANLNQIVGIDVFDLRSGFTASLNNAFQYGGGEMFISSVGPSEGTYFGGDLVTIFGNGFEGPVAVSFGGRAQQVVSVSGTEIVARSVGPVEIVACSRPSGPFNVVNIETNEGFTSGLTFTYRPVEPRIGSISVSSTTADIDTGAILGPTSLTMTGSGFDRQGFPPQVTFGGERSGSVTITSLDPDPMHEGNGVGDVMVVDIPNFQVPFPEEECTGAGGNPGMRFTEQRVDIVVSNRDTGCTDTVTAAFTYLPSDGGVCREDPVDPNPPQADFSFTANDLMVTFMDRSLGDAATAIRWDFGDGTLVDGVPGEQNRQHTYAAAGTFTVTLTATNAGGSTQRSREVTVTDP
ncbi:MAG: IPT/TIG domain-containing protein [Acidobacteriota bacterium]